MAANGLDGKIKMRGVLPDLLIMDCALTRSSVVEILKEKQSNPNTAAIPVIVLSAQTEPETLAEISKYKVTKIFTKPVKIDMLFASIAQLLGTRLSFDTTPCIIETHLNTDILFIEIAQGLNEEKIELLEFKIKELLALYEMQRPKTLLIMSDMTLQEADSTKLKMLFQTVLYASGSPPKAIKALSQSEYLPTFLLGEPELREIEVTPDLSRALNGLYKLQVSDFAHDGQELVKEDVLKVTEPKLEGAELVQLKFAREAGTESAAQRKTLIAVVDDDPAIRKWIERIFEGTPCVFREYENGRVFVEDLGQQELDLVFLDMMMPEMNGLQVLQHFKQHQIQVPVIVLSAMNRRETVTQAIQLGIKSYMVKPLKPENVIRKAAEVLRTSF